MMLDETKHGGMAQNLRYANQEIGYIVHYLGWAWVRSAYNKFEVI